MTFKKIIFSSFFFLSSIVLFAQNERKPTKRKTKIIPKFGVVTQGKPLFNPVFAEVGIVMQKNNDGEKYSSASELLIKSIANAFVYTSTELGVEFAKAREDWIIAPKATASLVVLVLEARLNVIAFIKAGKVDPRIVPELGINVRHFSLYVGWNAPLSNKQLHEVGLIRTSLIFMIPRIK